MKSVTDFFGTMVFNDQVMKERLPKEVYDSIQNTIQNGKHLDLSLANEIANAMKDWAIEKGATHYTHWFQPMTKKSHSVRMYSKKQRILITLKLRRR